MALYDQLLAYVRDQRTGRIVPRVGPIRGILHDPRPVVAAVAAAAAANRNRASAPAAQAQQQQQPQAFNILQRLIAGAYNPALSREQNVANARDALINAGLATLVASGQTHSPLAALAQGVLHGRQVFGQRNEQAAQQSALRARAQSLANILGRISQVNKESIDQTVLRLAQAAAAGDPTAQKLMSEFIQIRQQIGASDDRALTREQQAAQFEQTRQDREAAERRAREEREEARREAAAQRAHERDLADLKRTVDIENALADDFDRLAAPAREVADALANARAAGDNAVGDQTKIIALNKILDPASIVREGEFARVGKAGGLADQAQFYFNKLGKDGRLPSDLRERIDSEIESLAKRRQKNFRSTIRRYTARANKAGVDPDMVVYDPFDDDNDASTSRRRSGPGLLGDGGNAFEDLVPGGGR